MEKKIKKSFEEWCIENKHEDFLDLWDYELNNKLPSEIPYGTTKKYYFICPRNLHKSELKNINTITNYKRISGCMECRSFQQWCIDNNRQDLLDRWDYTLNKISPNKETYGTSKRYYFKCSDGIHESELHSLYVLTVLKGQCKCGKCNSFAFWGINNICEDFLEKYWDYENNTVDPWKISAQCNEKVWIKCQKKDYHGSYDVDCSNFYNGKRCPYCASKIVHPKDSFAQYHIDNTDKDFIEKYWSIKNKVNPFEISLSSAVEIWIKCQEKDYHEDYPTQTRSFNNGVRCSYCYNRKIHKFDSLGYLYPKSLEKWSDKNKKSPYEYPPHSEESVWWKCENGIHVDYERLIAFETRSDFRCPECVRERSESFLQEKVRLYLTEHYNFEVLHEHKCTIVPKNPKTKYPLPFDNEIVKLNLIVETHGIQHTVTSGFNELSAKHNNTTAEQELHYQKLKDRYKRLIAHHRGYFYLEISYLTEDDESYKTLIDNKIAEILAIQESEVTI